MGKSCATIESGKWVGPARVALDGEIVQVNEALVKEPISPITTLMKMDGWLS